MYLVPSPKHVSSTPPSFNLILAPGGYEDDVDNGDEFLYTGSGGRDLGQYTSTFSKD